MFEEERRNDLWIEDAFENFDQAVLVGDYPTANLIVADTYDAGFRKEALHMKKRLGAVKLVCLHSYTF